MEYGNILTLSGLAQQIQGAFRDSLEPTYWIRAEIHRLNVYGGTGHAYLELVDKERGRVVAKMSGTLWRDNYQRVANNFLKVTGEPFRDGLQVLMQVQVRFHEVYGLSVNVLQVDPAYSLGQMARMRMETLSRLKQEGEFYANQRLSLPPTLTRIAVISGASSKGYKDFVQKVLDYTERYQLRIGITLFPALLDGQNAIDTIPVQLAKIGEQKDKFDAICIIRGGGGEVGISAFDHYKLAAAVCQAPLPVFTGIGHSTNETVTELVAHKNGITPTDVATFIAQHQLEAVGELEQLIEQTFRLAEGKLFDTFQNLHNNSTKLESVVKHQLLVERSQLRELGMRVVVLPKRHLTGEQRKLSTHLEQLEKYSQRLLQQQKGKLQEQELHFERKLSESIDFQKTQLNQLENSLQLLNPEQVLKRGYSITRYKGKAIHSTADIQPGVAIETTLFEGKITSEIITKDE